MFADNQRISRLQAERQFALTYLGPALLWTVTGLKGRNGLCSVVLGTLFLCLWVFFLLRQTHVYRYPEKYWGTFMSRVWILMFQVYLILTGGWLVAKVTEILTEYLVQGISSPLAAGILVLTALGGSPHIQARGRFAQAAWPIVSTLTAVLFGFAMFQGETGFLQGTEGIWRQEDLREIVRGTGWFVVSFLGIAFLPFLLIQAESGTGHAGALFWMIGKMGLGLGGVLLLLQAVFGKNGTEALEYPVLDLMAGVRLPGGFLRRADLIFLTVIVFSLLFSLGSIFFYSKYICERVGLPASRLPAAVLCYLLGTAGVGSRSLTGEYERIMGWVILPLFLAVTVCTAWVRRKNHGR